MLAGMVGGTVDADHVRMHWDEALRLAVSVGSGHASASSMLRRLAAYPRQNRLAVALREIGRMERSLFTLDWLRSGELRRRANAGLNKGEARTRWHGRYSSTAWVNCATAPSRTRPFAPQG